MSYNKARAEKEWLRWKNEEEKQLREMGVSEDIIQRLHTYDWEQFKSDRRYYEKAENLDEYIDTLFAKEERAVIATAEDLMESIESEQLYEVLETVDLQTIEVVLRKLEGFTSKKISVQLRLSANQVDLNFSRFRKRLKNFFHR